jgi:small RNA 2'-O-methyltransferase
VLDVGCGEGELLHVLSQPASWLAPDPSITTSTTSATANTTDSEIINLHPTHVHGLDISARDLKFAMEGAQPRKDADGGGDGYGFGYRQDIRWEELEVCIWKGGLEVWNEELVGVECIVAMEV